MKRMYDDIFQELEEFFPLLCTGRIKINKNIIYKMNHLIQRIEYIILSHQNGFKIDKSKLAMINELKKVIYDKDNSYNNVKIENKKSVKPEDFYPDLRGHVDRY